MTTTNALSTRGCFPTPSVVQNKEPKPLGTDLASNPIVDALLEGFADALAKGVESLVDKAVENIGKFLGPSSDGFDFGPAGPAGTGGGFPKIFDAPSNDAPFGPAGPAGTGGGFPQVFNGGGGGFDGGGAGGSWEETPVAASGGASAKLAPRQVDGPTPSGDVKGSNDLSGFRTNKYDSIIKEMAAKYKVPARLIKSVIEQESKFILNAGSRVGAKGLMQLMPGTAREVGVRNVYDPRQNIEGGTKYLARMLKMFKGNVRLALAAYNAGPGNVLKHKGVPPFRETQTYVRNITANYYQ